jgi:hypothetical protein
MGGKPAKVRGTIEQALPTSFTFKMEPRSAAVRG